MWLHAHSLICLVALLLILRAESLVLSKYDRSHHKPRIPKLSRLSSAAEDAGDEIAMSRVFDLIKEVAEDEKARKTIASITAISAPLGVFLDNQHGLFGVLEYNYFNWNVENQGVLLLRSAAWVPVLFAFAGWIMSYIQLVTDKFWESEGQKITPTPWGVLYGISAFSAIYWLSGLLDSQQVDPYAINLILSASSAASYIYFDFGGTKAGLLLAVATAISGTLAEVALTSVGLYQYTHADVLKIASWIPAVYFAGGPAVGNLARYIYRR